jgi:hypothetical protein
LWILVNHGIDNLIVNPGDVPRIHKERLRKSDPIDSRKLARELEHHSLKSNWRSRASTTTCSKN